jgi:drug/metabolite transporter (DMT)-like permease
MLLGILTHYNARSMQPNKLSPRAVGILCAIITISIWTMFIVVARFMALKSLTPFDIVFCRIVGASVVLVPWGYFIVRKLRFDNPAAPHWLGISPVSFKTTALVGVFGGLGYSLFAYSGFLYAPAAHASVLLPGMLPLTTAIFSGLLLQETFSRQRLAGLAIILLGGILVGGVSIWKGFNDGGSTWVGDLLFVCASTCWAMYTVQSRKQCLGAVPATIAICCFCAVVYLPAYVGLIASGLVNSQLGNAPMSEILFQGIWQGMGSVVISGITFTKMVQYFGPVRSTMMTALVPSLSAIGAVIFLGEPLYWNLIAGLLMVTVGLIVGVRAVAVKR